MNFKVLLGVILLFFSCNRATEQQLLLTNGDYKYWDLYVTKFESLDEIHYYEKPICIGSYRLSIVGDCKYFHKNYHKNKNGKREPFKTICVQTSEKWEIKNDTIILDGYKHRLIKLTNDSLLCIDQRNDTTILRNSQDQKDGEEYKSYIKYGPDNFPGRREYR